MRIKWPKWLRRQKAEKPFFSFDTTADWHIDIVNHAGETRGRAALYLAESGLWCGLKVIDTETRCYTGIDYFDCFLQWRQDLEQQHKRPLCLGATENVWPSGLLRQMSRGLSAYPLTIGQAADPADIVCIFSAATQVVDLVTQQSYYQRWRNTIEETPSL